MYYRNGFEACAVGLTFSNSLVASFICLDYFINATSNGLLSSTWVNSLPIIITFVSIALFCLSSFPIWFGIRKNAPISRWYYFKIFSNN